MMAMKLLNLEMLQPFAIEAVKRKRKILAPGSECYAVTYRCFDNEVFSILIFFYVIMAKWAF